MFFCSNLIQKEPGVHLEMAAPQRGQSYQAAGQAPLVSLVRAGQAGWSQVVVACQPPKGHLGMNQKLLIAVLQLLEAVVMMHLGALSFFHSVQERGNKV